MKTLQELIAEKYPDLAPEISPKMENLVRAAFNKFDDAEQKGRLTDEYMKSLFQFVAIQSAFIAVNEQRERLYEIITVFKGKVLPD